MTTDALYDKVEEFTEAGDNAGLQSFVLAHLEEFPEEDRNEFVFAFFQGVVTATANEAENRHSFIEEALQALLNLDEMRALLEEGLRTEAVRGRLEKRAA